MMCKRRHTASLTWGFASVLVILLALCASTFAPPLASAASDGTPADHATLDVQVSYTGAHAPDETFAVAVTPQDGAPAPVNGAEQSVALSTHKTLGTIVFDFNLKDQPIGTFRYTVAERAGTAEGVSYSTKVYVVEFETYLNYGQVEVTPFRVYDTQSTYSKPAAISFDNTYHAKRSVIGDPPVRVGKAIEGDAPAVASQFVFVMRPTDPASPLPTPASSSVVIVDGAAYVTVNGRDEVEIGDIEFTDPGEYHYTVRERDDRIAGYSYDDAVFDVVYTVREDGKGGLTCTRAVFKDGSVYTTGDKPLVFANTYTEPHPDPDTTTLHVRVDWHDAGNADGIRPESITLKILEDGVWDGRTLVITERDATDGNTWVGEIVLPKHNVNGGLITYSIDEQATAVVAGEDGRQTYAFEVSGDAEHGFVVVNTHTPETSPVPTAPANRVIAKLMPKTGDPLSFVPLASVAVLAGSLVVVACKRRRRRESHDGCRR